MLAKSIVYSLLCVIFFSACSPINKRNRIKKSFELATQKLDDAYYDDAIVLYSQVIKMDHELVDAYLNRGVAYYETGHFSLALADYNHVRQQLPDFNDVLFNRVYTYLAMERYNMATDDLELLTRLYPDTALVDVIRGLMFGQQKNFIEAKDSFEKALVKDSNQFDAWTNLGVINFHLKEYDKAESDFARALQIRGNSPEVLNPLSLVYLNQGKLEQADSTIDVAIGLMADQAYFLNNKGLIQIHLGNYALADSLINRSLILDPSNEEARTNLELLNSKR
ncbi:MAG: tetratricopeptide repeat protein [Reichenbachiella sp.]|uniref:tetratricopeptide repeat protein n=1 Tax=Reichenbachiella sp. TaxID=2184521 RepID=UPI003266B59C